VSASGKSAARRALPVDARATHVTDRGGSAEALAALHAEQGAAAAKRTVMKKAPAQKKQ
jgi:hypothetical protein